MNNPPLSGSVLPCDNTRAGVPAVANAGAGVAAAKAQLRSEMRQALAALSAEYRAQASATICRRLENLDVWRRARSILVYASRPDEPDTCALISRALEEGKRLALPSYDPKAGAYRACQIDSPVCDLRAGKFGIPEPGEGAWVVPLNQLDLVLVPGVAFDSTGHRLGRGRGFYDRLLAGVQAMKCGLGFDEQVKSEIPAVSHDIVLDCILTPTRWLVFGPRRSGDDLVG